MTFQLSDSLNYLLSWVKEFDFVDQDIKPAELCDGVVISKILMAVAPFFTDLWESKIRTGEISSSVDKCFNLNHIVGDISQFFEHVVGQHLAVFQLPNVSLIAERNDEGELLRLLQLVICCALNGKNKENYIQAILNMDRSVQQAIMESVQEVMDGISSKGDELSIMSKSDRDDAMNRKCHDLEMKVAHLETDKAAVEAELEDALRKIGILQESRGDGDDCDETVGSVSATLLLHQLQGKLHSAQEELFQSEAEAQELKMRLSETLKTVEELQKSNEALTLEVAAAAHIKDELDICREELQAANRQVAALEQWKKRRADETMTLRIRCAKLEEDNAACLQVLGELKQENRLNSSLRANVEASRNQSVEATSRVSKLELQIVHLEEELKHSRAEHQACVQENRTLSQEMKRLQDRCEKASTPTDLEPGDCLGHLHSSFNPSAFKPDESSCSSVQGTTSDAVYEVEQRYRGYLAKALEVIHQLDRRVVTAETAAASSGEQNPSPEISRLQALLVEKESIIEQLEHHHEKARRQRDLEDRMVLTAWYHLGMRVNRAHTERLLQEEASAGGDLSDNTVSFLSQQRRVHLQSPNLPRSTRPPL